MNADVGGLALGPAQRLVNHDPGIGQAVAFAFGPRGEKNGAHAGGLADAVGVHLTGDVLHRIVNREAGSDIPTGRVDIDADVFFGVLHLQKEKLGNDRVGHAVIDGGANEDDAILEQA